MSWFIYEKARRWWIEESGDQTHRLSGIILLVLCTPRFPGTTAKNRFCRLEGAHGFDFPEG
jgi:hypothetical protein